MIRRYFVLPLCLSAAAFATFSGGPAALAVDPNPLQSAYWRFEEGTAGSTVLAAEPGNEGPGVVRDSVIDSIGAGKVNHENHMQAFNTDTAPFYTNANLPPTYLRSGERNTLAFDVGPHLLANGRDVYTHDSEINNGVFDTETAQAPGVPATTGFTLEAAFSVRADDNPENDFDFSQGIVAKEGRPGLKIAPEPSDGVFQSLPTAVLKVRGGQLEGDPDAGKLQFEMFDGAGNLVSVATESAVMPGQWYYAAVVNDGETVSLYLDSNDGQGYQLIDSETVDGVLFQGLNYSDPSWDYNWTIGRSTYGGLNDEGTGPFEFGRPADWFDGFIDEVRLTNSVLTPNQFLFTQTRIGDLNADGSIDGGDFLAWQREFDATLDADDYADWAARFGGPGAVGAAGAVPEPAGAALFGLAAVSGLLARRRR